MNNNNYCEKFKEFSRHYYLCYLDSEDELLLDLESINVLIKYIDLINNKLIRESLPNKKKI